MRAGASSRRLGRCTTIGDTARMPLQLNVVHRLDAIVLLRTTRLIHADGRFASYSSLKRESSPVVARDESKQLADRLRRRRFTQGVTHVPRQIIEFFRCLQTEVWELAPILARLGE